MEPSILIASIHLFEQLRVFICQCIIELQKRHCFIQRLQ